MEEQELEDFSKAMETVSEIINGFGAIVKGTVTGLSMIDKSVKNYERSKKKKVM